MADMVSTERVSDEFLCINSCDCLRLKGLNVGSCRPNGRVDYQLLYVAKGKCRVNENGCEITVCENSVILYLPGKPQIYCVRETDETVLYYVHFCGTHCEKILSDLNLYDKFILKLGKDAGVERIFEKLVREFCLKQPFYEQSGCAILISLFSAIARDVQNVSRIENKIVYDVCTKMHREYAENITMSEYAKMLNISVGRFTHVFTRTMGVSPKQYLLRIRFDHAAELLANTDLTVAQISELVGISDSNYFSRVFKKHMGHSPNFYRQR